MSKYFLIAVFNLLPLSLTFAAPLQHLLPLEKPISAHTLKNTSRTQAVITTQNYTDFTGQWSGTCQTSDERIDSKAEINIKNDQHWIQLSLEGEGSSNSYEIGKKISQDLIEPDFFILGHALFSWTDDARLLLNHVGIYAETLPDGELSVGSTSGRAIFSLKEDKLILQQEINVFEDAEASTPYKVVCELTK